MGLESKNLNLIVYLDSALDKHYYGVLEEIPNIPWDTEHCCILHKMFISMEAYLEASKFPSTALAE